MANISIEQLLNVNDPASHCNQDHDHNSLPWPLEACTWEDQLLWSMSDTGYNEGAGAAVELANTYGLQLPPEVAILGGDALANAWPRRDMMRYAIDVAKAVNPGQGTALAIVSQWHNCHAFRCLVFHAGEVADWLLRN